MFRESRIGCCCPPPWYYRCQELALSLFQCHCFLWFAIRSQVTGDLGFLSLFHVADDDAFLCIRLFRILDFEDTGFRDDRLPDTDNKGHTVWLVPIFYQLHDSYILDRFRLDVSLHKLDTIVLFARSDQLCWCHKIFLFSNFFSRTLDSPIFLLFCHVIHV